MTKQRIVATKFKLSIGMNIFINYIIGKKVYSGRKTFFLEKDYMSPEYLFRSLTDGITELLKNIDTCIESADHRDNYPIIRRAYKVALDTSSLLTKNDRKNRPQTLGGVIDKILQLDKALALLLSNFKNAPDELLKSSKYIRYLASKADELFKSQKKVNVNLILQMQNLDEWLFWLHLIAPVFSGK
jgi:hypothetical protein